MKEIKSIYFDPKDIIENSKEFTRELIIYKEENDLNLFIIKEGMEPLVEIDGVKYRGLLEYPTMIRSDNPILKALSFTGNTFGYKIVALHPVE